MDDEASRKRFIVQRYGGGQRGPNGRVNCRGGARPLLYLVSRARRL